MRHKENHMRLHVYMHHATCVWAIVLGLVLLVMAGPTARNPSTSPPPGGATSGPAPGSPAAGGAARRTREERRGAGHRPAANAPGRGERRAERSRDLWGLAEYTLNVDTQKLGLWPGGFLRVQGMSSFGQNINHASGALISPSLVSLLPEPGGAATGLMNLTFMQFLSKHFGVFLGKVSGLGADDNAFAHDYHSTFLNSALDFNMALALFPFTAYGGGLVILPWDGAVFTVSALDPSGTATNNDISDAFQDGVLVAAEGRVTIKPFGLVGHQLLGGGWSNKERVSLEQDPSNIGRTVLTQQFPRLVDPGPVLARFLERFFPALLVPTQPLNQVDYTWSVYYNFDQYLWSPEGVPDRGIGVFFRFGASDGVANPVKYAYNVGIGAKGLWSWRPCDNFGIGWARTVLSDNFVPLLRQQLRLGLGHEDAIELYYNAAITPWLSAALDLQIIDQALERTLNASGSQLRDMNTAVVLGLRVYARF